MNATSYGLKGPKSVTTTSFKKISVIGMGYIGLPTAAMFASRQIEVVGVDVIPEVVDKINQGEIHIVEPDLDIAVRAVVTEGYLRASLVTEPAEAFLVAVPTPFKGDNHDPDLTYIRTACEAIAPVLEAGNLVILESTSPVGATRTMAEWLADLRPDLTFPQTYGEVSDIRIAHCPERVLPGKVMHELVTNDRIIGGMTEACTSLACRLYQNFVTGECVQASSPAIAELAKLAENSFRDVNIAFANELSLICDRVNVDIWELISLANRHPRVNILQPGPGVGGHCIAVDPWFIVASDRENARLIRTAREVNDFKPDWVLLQIRAMVQSFLQANPNKCEEDVTLACYGLAFKPDIDDLRESPALDIQKRIQDEFNGKLVAVEPNISHLPPGLDRVELVTLEQALVHADVHAVLVGHKQFREAMLPTTFTIRATAV